MNDYSKKKQLIEELNLLRKKSSEGLQPKPISSTENFQLLANQSPNMIFINKKGRIIFANKLCEELMGYSKEELYSSEFDFQVLVVPDDQKRVMASFQRHMHGEEIAPNEYRLMTKAGKQIDTIITTKLINIDGDHSILGIVTDITELKRTEKLLRDSEKLYKSLIETLPDAVSRTDLSGNITFISNQNLKLLGYKNTEELIGKSAFIFISPDDHKRARANLKNNLSGKPSTNVEYKILRKDGTTFTGEVNSSIIRDSDGEPESILAVVRDVTKRKKAEDALRESEHRYLSLLELSFDGTAIYYDGKIIHINKAGAKILGAESPDEIIGRSSMDFIHPDSVEINKKRMQTEPDKFGVGLIEEKFLRLDGTVIDLEAAGIPIIYKNKEARQAIFRDISKRKQIENELRESDNRFRELAANIREVFWSFDLINQKVLYVSPAYEEIWGRSSKSLIDGSIKWEESIHPDDLDFAIKNFHDIAKTGEGKNWEYRIVRPDKSIRWISDQGFAIYSDKDEAERIVGIAEDITFRKHAEEKMINYQKQLKSLASNLSAAEERERRKIAQEIHNRIGQSLAVSKIKISELQEQVKESKISKPLQNIRVLLEQMISETRSLTFELSPPVLYELGLEPAIEWLVEQFQENHNLQIKMNICEEIKPINDEIRFVLFDAVRELFMNIVKHSSAKSIVISTKRRNNTANITVEDDGIGFDVSKLDFKASSQDGFGYFHIRERMEYLGGRLSVKSVPGQGTSVTLSVPLK